MENKNLNTEETANSDLGAVIGSSIQEKYDELCKEIKRLQEKYDENGYDSNGYDGLGYDHLGYDKEGYNQEGYNKFNKKKNEVHSD